ncbi:MAG TPA: beta-ketoacyl-ACP reductase [Firmicutes bacterium]|nr:beta-ketoacyl-ACP reductase [Bacillota bacterium]
MNLIYNTKTVLITGGIRGLGAAIAINFASHNYNIILNYLNDDTKATETKKIIEEKYNVEVTIIKKDISNETEVKELLDEVTKKYPEITTIVNNAAIAIDSTIEDKTVEDFKKVLNTNLIGTFLMCKYFGQYMQNHNGESIVNISSTNAIDSYYPYSMDYDASKSGVISLTHNFANLYAKKLRVNCVAPGWILTEAIKGLDDEQIKEECDKILLNRFASPEEIAESVYFSATSTYLNDSILKIDGGRKQC